MTEKEVEVLAAVLTGRDITEAVFHNLIGKKLFVRIVFKNPAMAIIADDSDYHRTARGYMVYKEVHLGEFNGNLYALGLGTASNDYPAFPFANDIIALKIEPDSEVSEKRLANLIYCSSFFKNSLIFSLWSGQIACGKNFWAKLNPIYHNLDPYIVKNTVVDRSQVYTSDLMPVVKQPFLYNTRLIELLAEKFTIVLSSLE